MSGEPGGGAVTATGAQTPDPPRDPGAQASHRAHRRWGFPEPGHLGDRSPPLLSCWGRPKAGPRGGKPSRSHGQAWYSRGSRHCRHWFGWMAAICKYFDLPELGGQLLTRGEGGTEDAYIAHIYIMLFNLDLADPK